MNLTEQLQRYFGFSEFREGQQNTIEHVLKGHSALAIFPTGSGKSLCYQLSALNLPHLTLVVSPLLSLMHDQLAFLHDKGVPAASLDSSLSKEAYAQVMDDARCGRLKILMISVERFKNERFRNFIRQVPISLLVVDEAHCISEWGHNFRPDYLKLPHYMQTLNISQALLLTATAPSKVKKDMQNKFNIKNDQVIQTGFYRPNLDIAVEAVKPADKEKRLHEIIASSDAPTIVYVTLQQSAEQVAQALINNGVNASAYHAGLSSEERQSIQSRFMNDELTTIVATIAFGMGIDKSNIRRVIHYDIPKSIENYSQEIGRAGRDGHPSSCIVLGDLNGVSTLESFVYGDTPEQQSIKLALDYISKNVKDGQWEHQGLALSNLANIRQLPLKTLLVALEMRGVISPKYSYFAEYKYKFLADRSTILARFDEARREFLTSLFEHSVCRKVWCEPPFGVESSFSMAERDRAIAALEYLDEKGLIELAVKGITDVYQVDTQKLTEKHLVQELAVYFKEKEQAEITRINELLLFLQSRHCLTASLCRYFDDNNAPNECGHCSVCRTDGVDLPNEPPTIALTEGELSNIYNQLKDVVARSSESTVSTELLTRFLLGFTGPIFTKIKARKMQGYGVLQNVPYMQVHSLANSVVS